MYSWTELFITHFNLAFSSKTSYFLEHFEYDMNKKCV